MPFNIFKGFSRNIVSETYDHCMEFLNNSRCKTLPFHSVQHTLDVYKYVKTIANYEEVFGSDLEPILIAALFHDTGMAETYEDHEDKSVELARKFLLEREYPEDKLKIVESCILATKMPQNPQTQEQKIICDADLYHLGLESYIFRNERLRSEWEEFFNKKYTDEEWFAINVEFLENQKFHTWFGQTVLRNRKDINCKMLKERKEKYQL